MAAVAGPGLCGTQCMSKKLRQASGPVTAANRPGPIRVRLFRALFQFNVQALSDQPSNGFRTRRLMGFTGAPAINSLLEI